MKFKLLITTVSTLLLSPVFVAVAKDIDPASFPVFDEGASGVQIEATDKAPGDGDPKLRERCYVGWANRDDFIVFPGKPGVSHYHFGWGKKKIDAFTTADSLAKPDSSTCEGGDHSAMWTPLMYNSQTGEAKFPITLLTYWFAGTKDPKETSKIEPFPPGLVMLAGDAHNTVKDSPSQKLAGVGFFCNGRSSSVNPMCNQGSQMGYKIAFPNCWNGKDLDSPDHKNHMAYTAYSKTSKAFICPATHPHRMPGILFAFFYKVDDPDGTKNWRLSSDMDTSLPAFISAHGDWAMGLDQNVQKMIIDNCFKSVKDCGTNLLGNGKKLAGRSPFNPLGQVSSKVKVQKDSTINAGDKLN